MIQKLHTPIQGKKLPDVLIIGAGIFGLWAARHAIKRGESVLVLDKGGVGAGASGGFLGALMPHMPDNWNAKKQRQYEALTSMVDAIALLEDETGVDCEFRRCGRLMPLIHEKMPGHAKRRYDGARENWLDANGELEFDFEVLGSDFKGTIAENWLSEELAPYGATFDGFSSRINPRTYLEALSTYVRKNGEIIEGANVISIDDKECSVTLADGKVIGVGRILIATGWEAYDMLDRINGHYGGHKISGRGIKGQAVLLEHHHEDNQPIIYDNGSYILPHKHNRMAIGATSNHDWRDEDNPDPSRFDPEILDFYHYGLKLAPSLAKAPVIERWAGVRPRNTIVDPKTGKVSPEPLFDPIDDNERIHIAIGGYKVSLALAHVEHYT